MNKGFKITLIVITTVFISGLIGGYYFLNMLNKAYGTECEESNEWTFYEYQIKEYRCIGWAGPPWYPMDIYIDGEKIANNVIKSDSCQIRFRREKELYLYLNICDRSIKEIRPNKIQLSITEIDSIQIVSNTSNQIKKLSGQQIEKIVVDWNQSQIYDYRDKEYESIFYPKFDYKIYIYHQNMTTEFITGNHLMADKNHWTYEMSSEKDKEYFNTIWNEK